MPRRSRSSSGSLVSITVNYDADEANDYQPSSIILIAILDEKSTWSQSFKQFKQPMRYYATRN
jgi:hypothetical protein